MGRLFDIGPEAAPSGKIKKNETILLILYF